MTALLATAGAMAQEVTTDWIDYTETFKTGSTWSGGAAGRWSQNIVSAPGSTYSVQVTMAVTDAVSENGTDRNLIGGTSYGSYMTLWLQPGGKYSVSVPDGLKIASYEIGAKATFDDNLGHFKYTDPSVEGGWATSPELVGNYKNDTNKATMIVENLDAESFVLDLAEYGSAANLSGTKGVHLFTLRLKLKGEESVLAARQLQTLIDQVQTYTGGTLVGEYSEASIAALSDAIATAEGKLTTGTVTADDVAALQTAVDALELNMPESGKFYQLATWKPVNVGKAAYVNNENNCYWGFNETPAAVWVFENRDGNYYLKNLATGTYVGTYNGNNGSPIQLVEDNTQPVTIEFSGIDRRAGIKVSTQGQRLNRNQSSPYAVCRWSESLQNSNSEWLINEVNPSDIKHTLSVGAAGWATLVLGFNATIPTTEGVTVYAVESTTTTSATLKPVAGVLPANTAVLVEAPANSTVEFAYTAESTSVRSLLEGTLYDKNITPAAGQTCYVLSMPADATEPGFYKAALNQESNTAFKNNANKVYLPVATDNGAPSLSFVFDTETGIEGVGAAEAGKSAIHDLSGRRVKGAQKGIYIINGKKVVK